MHLNHKAQRRLGKPKEGGGGAHLKPSTIEYVIATSGSGAKLRTQEDWTYRLQGDILSEQGRHSKQGDFRRIYARLKGRKRAGG